MVLKSHILPEKDLTSVTGKVVSVFEKGVKDICIRLEGNSNTSYINRGLEPGLDLDSLRKALVNNLVTIEYPQHRLAKKARTIHQFFVSKE